MFILISYLFHVLLEMHEKFLVAFGTKDGGRCDTEDAEVEALKCLGEVSDDRFVEGWIANNSAFAHHAFSHLKLRLDQADHVTRPLYEIQHDRDNNL